MWSAVTEDRHTESSEEREREMGLYGLQLQGLPPRWTGLMNNE